MFIEVSSRISLRNVNLSGILIFGTVLLMELKMKYKSGLLAVILFFFAYSQLNAHEDHDKKKEKPDTVTVVNGDTIAINGIAIGDSLLATQEAVLAKDEHIESTEEYELNAGNAFFEHIHNKIIHFPIVTKMIVINL
jgi:hypothetical protein